jgi:uncharacterized membrane protein YebE (DUF533 family)
MLMTLTLIAFALQGATPEPAGNAALALLILLVAAMGWFGLRTLVRGMRAGKAANVVQGNFNDFALQALVNAAKIDGRVDSQERVAIGVAMEEIGGANVDAAFAKANLSKHELVAYLGQLSRGFTHEQKQWLLRSLLAVFVADGRFDESEHAALIDYTAAVGFDRQSAPDMLRGLSQQFKRGNIT